ncbi:hypothetical protein [Thiohalobacter thiocyanaticus]|uniref:Uncharacterized protein n=1 Tax=Thiohalobacter thiocyanaticus TaxID=585455 RepID=A0A426QG20_9GAMM|nr:hypothetical protein [Thiohalobacter thiocyanaticus]RRQ20696.1 hypothetical protein D6C00_00985 [Thiohalobacter thiocyanaticus]
MRHGNHPQDRILDQARLDYIEQLRTIAAGRGGEDQHNLTQVRARRELADAQLKELELSKQAGELVPSTDAEALMSGWASSGRREMEVALDKAVDLIERQHEITVDRADVDDIFEAAFSAIADYPQFYDFTDTEVSSDSTATS